MSSRHDDLARLMADDLRRLAEVPAPVLCASGKTLYASEEQAQEALDYLRRKQQRHPEIGKVPSRAYPCPRCGCWHLTSMERG